MCPSCLPSNGFCEYSGFFVFPNSLVLGHFLHLALVLLENNANNIFFFPTFCRGLRRERFRTTSNMLDDCFAVAIVEELSKKDLDFDDSKSLESEKMLHKTLLIV